MDRRELSPRDVSSPRSRARRTSSSVGQDGAGPTIDELIDIATRFYVRGESQIEIAQSLGRDPSSISRYLRQIRDTGIVRFEIRRPRERADGIAATLGERFGLHRAIVVTGFDDVAQTAADFLASQLVNEMQVGISWGRMLTATVHRLPADIVSNLDISALHGGAGNTGTGSEGHELARHMVSLYPGSRVTHLLAPVLVDTPEIKQAMVRDGSIRAALQKARTRELAIVGIGAVDKAAPLVRYGHIDEASMQRLLAAGAVGDVSTRFFTAQGERVDVIDDRLIAIEWEELSRIPRVVGVAAGPDKVEAILGALRAGLINTLVTDEQTAQSVIASADSS